MESVATIGEFPTHQWALPMRERAPPCLARWMQTSGKTPTVMNNLLNIIIALLVIGWLVGFIGFGTAVGSLIHILIVLAVIGIIYQLVAGRKANL